MVKTVACLKSLRTVSNSNLKINVSSSHLDGIKSFVAEQCSSQEQETPDKLRHNLKAAAE